MALCVFQKAIESQKGQKGKIAFNLNILFSTVLEKDRAFTMMRMFAVATDLHSVRRSTTTLKTSLILLTFSAESITQAYETIR